MLVRIDRTGKNAPIAPARSAAPPPVAPSAGSGSFIDSAEDAALALQIEQDLLSGTMGRGGKDAKKEALESIDDIAARNSLNIVERKPPKTQP